MTFTPYDFQRADLDYLRDRNYTGLLSVQPGGGKTPLSLFAAKESGASQTLIIAPKSTFKKTWQKTTENIQGVEARIIGNTLKAERQALTDLEWGVPGVYLMSPQLFTRADISLFRPDLLIADEVHQINKPGGKGQRKLSGFSARDTPISQQIGGSLTLSGTPVRSAFERAWSICRLHWPHLDKRRQVAYSNYYGWLAERMTSKKMVVGRNANGSLKYATEWLAEREEGKLFSELPSLVQHFRREQCCWFHPNGFLLNEEPNEVERIVELSPAQKRIISEIEDQGLAWIDDNPFSVDLPLTAHQRIRQVCLGEPVVVETGELDEYGFPKTTLEFPEDTHSTFIDETLNILEQLGDEPVVIYLSSQKFAQVLTARINKAGVTAFEYSGKTSKTRDEGLEGFGTKYRVVVGVVSALGTGTDSLQHAAKTEIWLEVPLDDVDTIQSQARLDRLGQTEQVQRFWVHDDLGYSQGMFSKKLAKRLEVAKSTRVAV